MIWIITLFSIIGVILNVYQNKWCFVIWMVTNTSWMIIDFYYGLYAQAALFAVYTVLAVFGFVKWRKNLKTSVA